MPGHYGIRRNHYRQTNAPELNTINHSKICHHEITSLPINC